MKARVFILAFTILFILSLSGCSSDVRTMQPQGDNVIRVGWIGALTGDSSGWGQCELNTIKLMFREINSSGGVLGQSLEVIGYDTKGDPFETVNAVKSLTENDKVAAILGPNTSSCAIPIAPVLEEAKVPDIATVATNPEVTSLKGSLKPYNFRVCFIDSFQGAAAAGFALETLKTVRAAILFDSRDQYSQELAKYFEKYYTEHGGTVVASESFKSGDTDFGEQLNKIKAADPELLFMPYYYREAALSAIQARKLGINAIFMGGDGWPSDQLLSLSDGALEGSYYVSHYNPEDSRIIEFKKTYEDEYKSKAEINVFLTHDAVDMLVDAINRAGKPDSAAIAAALEATDIKGITGRIKIGKYTHNPEGKEASIIKIENGKEIFQQYYVPKQ